MKLTERIVIVLICLSFITGGSWLYFSVNKKQQDINDAVARGDYNIPIVDPFDVKIEDWALLYPETVPLIISSTTVLASVADSLPERIQGLSNTPFLPDNVVKLFIFGVSDIHSIWMKDMNYSLDIIWLSEDGEILYFEENISPETYPEQSFSSPMPAWYVIETNAGFVSQHGIKVGDKVRLLQ